jgi:hypothetical protein
MTETAEHGLVSVPRETYVQAQESIAELRAQVRDLTSETEQWRAIFGGTALSDMLALKQELRDALASAEVEYNRLIGEHKRMLNLSRQVLTNLARTETERDQMKATVEQMGDAGTGIGLIAVERARHALIGYTPEHDLHHDQEQLIRAAECYLSTSLPGTNWPEGARPIMWPFDPESWRAYPDDRVRELVIAGSLIAAEIDRIHAVHGQRTAIRPGADRAGLDIWRPMDTAPRDGTEIRGYFDPDEIVPIRWSEQRRCMLGDVAPGAGVYPPGWEDVANGLPVDDPQSWKPNN